MTPLGAAATWASGSTCSRRAASAASQEPHGSLTRGAYSGEAVTPGSLEERRAGPGIA